MANSSTPWKLGRGYEQADPGFYIYNDHGIVYASCPGVCMCEPISEEDLNLIIDVVNESS